MTQDIKPKVEEWEPQIHVRIYRGDHLIEQRFSNSPEAIAELVETLESSPSPEGSLIVVEPHPPAAIVQLLRAIADAIEEERPVPMTHPLPHLQLQLVTEGASETGRKGHGRLHLVWQELSHPGD